MKGQFQLPGMKVLEGDNFREIEVQLWMKQVVASTARTFCMPCSEYRSRRVNKYMVGEEGKGQSRQSTENKQSTKNKQREKTRVLGELIVPSLRGIGLWRTPCEPQLKGVRWVWRAGVKGRFRR